MIKESCNLIVREPQFATPIQKLKFHILSFSDGYLSAKHYKVSSDSF